jgi:hypothetical protein
LSVTHMVCKTSPTFHTQACIFFWIFLSES